MIRRISPYKNANLTHRGIKILLARCWQQTPDQGEARRSCKELVRALAIAHSVGDEATPHLETLFWTLFGLARHAPGPIHPT